MRDFMFKIDSFSKTCIGLVLHKKKFRLKKAWTI